MNKARNFYETMAAKFPITPWGMIFLTLCALSFWFIAVKQLDIIYLSMSILWTFVFLLMFFWVLIISSNSKKRLQSVTSSPFLKMTVGYPIRTGYYVPSFAWTPFINITWSWAAPEDIIVEAERKNGYNFEVVTPKRRGFHDEIKRKIEIGDIFGFTRIRWEVRESLHVQILPDHGRLTNMNMLLSLFRGEDISHPEGLPEGDRIEIRRYVAGDSLKTIMWKIYAQTRKLYVRTPECAVAMRPRVAAYLASGRGDEPSASLARVLIENRMLGREWMFGADGSPHPATEMGEALRILSKSGNERKMDPENMKNFLESAASTGVHHCLIMLPGDMSGWKDLINEVGQSRVKIHFMIVFDSQDKEGEKYKGRIKNFMIARDAPESSMTPDISTIMKALPANAGCLYLIDRRTGRIFREGNLGRRK